MAKALVIVESPAKAKTISKILGPGYVIKASMGHVRDLPIKEFGVDLKNDFKPQYVLLSRRKKLIKELKDISKSSTSVYLAPDPDREGEAIAWHLSELLKHDNVYRVAFNEITRPAVLNAFSKPGRIDERKVDSQQTRRILDRIVGYKISPLLWKSVGKGLSAGRVQSVAVMLVCQRDAEIDQFVAEEYWSIIATLSRKDQKETFGAKLDKIDGKPAKLEKEDQVNGIIDDLKKQQYTVSNIAHKQKLKWSPPPFITSQLQQSASNKLRYSVQKTMQVAQQLYEGIELGKEGNVGLITYMRTDSFRVSQEALGACRKYIKNAFGAEFVPDKPRTFKAKKGAQEAHEAIRPSYMDKKPDTIRQFLTDDQFKLYSLIWERFIASQMAPAKLKITTAEIAAGKYLFKCTSEDVLFPGYLLIEKGENITKNEEEKEDFITKIPTLKKNEVLDLKNLEGNQHFTKPPPRYTEASLVRTLEEQEIGRPSTYAPTIQTILKRGYVKKDKGKLFATELGKDVTRILVGSFPDIINVQFTASMEKQLDSIEDGEADWKNLLKTFYNSFMLDLVKATKNTQKVKKAVIPTDEKCEVCGSPMVIRTGRYGEFLACSAFPKCKHIKPKDTGVRCPEEGCDGILIERRSKKGKRFYGCSKYPQCKHTQSSLKKAR